MTQYNPFLKLNRLTIYTKSGKIAYDQNFHEGVNIIRGHNSAGKSTIGNFIFYVLGGDFKNGQLPQHIVMMFMPKFLSILNQLQLKER